MTHTTPTEAREVADRLEAKKLDVSTWVAVTALRSLAEQLEAVTEKRDFAVESAKYTADLCTQALADLKAVTADCEKFANQTFAAKAERDKCGSGAGCLHKDALIDSLTAERDALAVKLKRIADLDPEKNSEDGFNEWGQAHCFELARAIAKEKTT